MKCSPALHPRALNLTFWQRWWTGLVILLLALCCLPLAAVMQAVKAVRRR